MPDAPAWLREAFRDGVDDREMVYRDGVERWRSKQRPYAGANPWCWLAQFDPKRLPCAGQDGHLIERFHFLRRQSVEGAVGGYLPDRWELLRHLEAQIAEPGFWDDPARAQPIASLHGEIIGSGKLAPLADLVLLAAWDPRNGGLGCEHHHRRFDHQAGSPTAPSIIVPAFALPEHVDLYIAGYGLDQLAEETFEDYELDGDRAYLHAVPQ